MNSLVSIIMPAYNCEKYINESIDSILNQSYQNFELLISDDCSTDSTKKLLIAIKIRELNDFITALIWDIKTHVIGCLNFVLVIL